MGEFIEVKVESTHPTERVLEINTYAGNTDGLFRVRNLMDGGVEFAYIGKEELLDGLARLGWLPDEYRKPQPLDPREAKIRAVTLVIYNDDASREPNWFMKHYDTYEELAEDLGRDGEVADYRTNAEALIDAGLVEVSE